MSDSVSEDEVEEEEETNEHGCDDDVGAVPAMASNLFKPGGTQLKVFGRRSDSVAFALHHVDFVFVFKHPVQISSHLVGNCVERLLNSDCLAA